MHFCPQICPLIIFSHFVVRQLTDAFTQLSSYNSYTFIHIFFFQYTSPITSSISTTPEYLVNIDYKYILFEISFSFNFFPSLCFFLFSLLTIPFILILWPGVSSSDLQKNETRSGSGEGPQALRQADTYKECRKSSGWPAQNRSRATSSSRFQAEITGNKNNSDKTIMIDL